MTTSVLVLLAGQERDVKLILMTVSHLLVPTEAAAM